MTEGRLETESRCQECLAIIKGEVTGNNLSKRRVRTRTHGVVGGRGLVAPSYPIRNLRQIDLAVLPRPACREATIGEQRDAGAARFFYL